MTSKQSKILECLSRKRKPIAIGKLAQETDYNKTQMRRTLKPFEQDGLISVVPSGKENLVSITDKGKHYLKNTLVLTGKDAKPKNAEPTKLWKALGLETITLTGDPYDIYRKNNSPLHKKGFMRNYKSYEDALKEIDYRRDHGNVWFTPAETSAIKGKKTFKYSKALWIDLDIPKQQDGNPQPESIRQQNLSDLQQRLVNDGLLPNITVDSGFGYHIYFLFQNKIKEAERVSDALKALATTYKTDTKVTSPVQNLRVPCTKNFKSPHKKKPICKIIDFNPTNLNTLSHIESAIGLNWEDKRYRKWKDECANKTESETQTSKKSFSKDPILTEEGLLDYIKTGYKPKGKDKSPSARDFFIFCDSIRQGLPKQTIFNYFLDKNNAVSIYNHPSLKHGMSYLETSYNNAYEAVHGHPPDSDE